MLVYIDSGAGVLFESNSVESVGNVAAHLTCVSPNAVIKNNRFLFSASGSTRRCFHNCTDGVYVGNLIDAKGAIAFSSISGGEFSNNPTFGGTMVNISGGNFDKIEIGTSGSSASGISGGVFTNCSFWTSSNSGNTLSITGGSPEFYNCSIVQRRVGVGSNGHAVVLSTAASTPDFYNCDIKVMDVDGDPARAIINTSGFASTVDVRGSDIYGLIDFTDLTILNYNQYHTSANEYSLVPDRIGVGTTTPDASAIIDIASTDKGALIPRMTSAQRDAIPTPAEGLTIWNTENKQIESYNGTYWDYDAEGYMSIVDSSYVLSTTGTGTFDWITNATNTLWNGEISGGGMVVRGDSTIVPENGRYEVLFSWSTAGANTSTFETATLVNDVPHGTGGKTERDMTGTGLGVVGAPMLIDLSAGDVLKPSIERKAGATNPTFVQGNFLVKRCR